MKPESKQEVNAVVGDAEIPNVVMDKITEWLLPFFPDVSIDVCTGPIDQEKRNEIQRHKINCLKKGAIFGYQLAQQSQPPSTEIKQEQGEFKKLFIELISMAEDGMRLHIKNAVHQEFIEEDKEIIRKAKEFLSTPLPASQTEVLSKEEIWEKWSSDGNVSWTTAALKAMEEFHNQFKAPSPSTEKERMFTESDLRKCFNKSRRKDDFDGTYEYAVFGDFLKTLNL